LMFSGMESCSQMETAKTNGGGGIMQCSSIEFFTSLQHSNIPFRQSRLG
jgi:hypothetical protein